MAHLESSFNISKLLSSFCPDLASIFQTAAHFKHLKKSFSFGFECEALTHTVAG